MKYLSIAAALLILIGGFSIAQQRETPSQTATGQNVQTATDHIVAETVSDSATSTHSESAQNSTQDSMDNSAHKVSDNSSEDSVPADHAEAEKQLRETLARIAPDMEISAIAESVMPGVYELVSGAQVFYLTPDGRYMLEGSIIDLENRVDISEERRGGLQVSLIEEVPEDQMVVFNNQSGDADRWITVFTDTDCGFCQKLHAEIDTITDANIRVRYLLFPRAGIDSASSHELQSVWCSSDQQEAMTIAKSGGRVPSATCQNPIESHMAVARQVGLRGTPLIYLDNGTKIPGYQPAGELIRMIEESEPMAAAE